ncbi:MAG: TlpA family protein disulfide reductase [Mycobacteriales bacterium]
MSRGTGLVAAVAAAVLLTGCGSEHTSAGGTPTGGPVSTATPDPSLAACPPPGRKATTEGGRALPALTLPCLAGGADVALDRMTGVPTVVNLWASWCGPCRAETPALQDFSARAGAKVRVIGVATTDQSESTARTFLHSAGAHYASVYDESGKVRRALGLPGLPGTALLRPDGAIVKVLVGPVTTTSLTAAVSRYLDVSL